MNSGVEPPDETARHRFSARLRSVWTIPIALALIAAIYTAIFHFRAPYFDHWDLVPLMIKADAGTLDWQTLFRSHGSHWHASGYAAMLTNSAVFNKLHLLDSAASVIAMILGFPALARILDRVTTEDPSASTRFVLYAIGAFFYFSLDQAINLVWGWQCALFFSTSASLWAIEAFSRYRLSAEAFLFGTACIGFALTGFATAWALFPVCAGLILFHPQASRPRRALMLAGLFLALLLLLAGHFASNPQSHVESRTPTGLSAETIFGLGHYVVNYIGQGLFRLRPVAPFIGLFGVVSLVGLAWVSRGDWQARRALWAMAAFGYGTALLTALGRWQTFGPDQAFANRYATLANFTWIGIAALIYLERGRLTRTIPMAYPTLLALAISFGAAKGVNSIVGARNVAVLAHTVNSAAEDIALTWPETRDDTINVLGEHTSTMRDQLQYLCEKQRSVFINRAGPERCRRVSVE